MTAQVYTTRMPAGYVGLVSRTISGQVIEAEQLDGSTPPTAFGVAVQTDSTSGKLKAYTAAATITGALVRGYPMQGSISTVSNAYGSPTPVAGSIGSRMRRGYFMATCAWGTPVADGAVYIRQQTNGGTRAAGALGDLEATADSTYNVAITGWRWTGGVDANGVAEIAVNM